MSIHFCQQLPVEATTSGKKYVNRRLYRITTHYGTTEAGLYRQVARDGRTGLRAGEGNVVAVNGDNLIELSRDTDIEAALREAIGTCDAAADNDAN